MTDKPQSPVREIVLQHELDQRIIAEEKLTDRLAVAIERTNVSEEIFRLLVTSVVDYAIFMLDPEGRVASWNAGAARVKGYTANEIIGTHFSAFYPEEDVRAGKCEHELAEALAVGRFEDEGWRIRKDGTRFWANVIITPVRADDGTLIGFGKVTRDLTLRRQQELDRIAAEERFRLLVESVRDYAILILDPSGHITSWNVGAERIKGYLAEEIIGRHFSCFYPLEDVKAGKCEHELAVATREGRFEDENWRIRKDGTRFWANVVISAVRDRSGTLVGFSKVTRDLTDRRRSEEERAGRLAAEQANRSKDEFLAMLGHELRNPLAPIVTALQLIRLRGETQSTRELEVIERQVKHMMTLVDDLLDVSRITRGKLELKKTRVDLRTAIDRAVETASPLFEQRSQKLEISTLPYPVLVNGDEARLVQIITNLLTNAAKYTPLGGHIVVTLLFEDATATLQIRDDGSGIDAELLPRVFELFVQGQQDVDRAAGGLGLGLTLVRSLVRLHNGTVTAESAGPGKGSTFTVKLPSSAGRTTRDSGRHVAAAFPVAARGRRILLVDDNEDACALLAEILRASGHEVETAGDGPGALALVDDHAPELAILDIGLPVMDGYELATQLRARLGNRIRLISLTGYGQQSDRDRSLAAGFDLHLVKPIDAHRLLTAIRDLAPIE